MVLLGVFEMENFAKGTIALGNAIAKATEKGPFLSLVVETQLQQLNNLALRQSKLCEYRRRSHA